MDWSWWQFAPLAGMVVVAVIAMLYLCGLEQKVQQARRDHSAGKIRRPPAVPPVTNDSSRW